MKRKGNLFQILGIALILLSGALLLGSQALARHRSTQAKALAQQIEAQLPSRRAGTTEDYSDPAMPVWQLQGEDFLGLVEVPSFGVTLPIHSLWEDSKLSSYPCRYWGSIYDGTLILGGSSEAGQFDFCEKLDLGERIIVTDMQGTQFSCGVERIDRADALDYEALSEGNYPLILFARTGSGNYIVIRCVFSVKSA